MSESDSLQLLQECNAEIAALREKLAAAEASLAERGRMLELTHRVQRSYRAAVAAALAELRAKLDVMRYFERHTYDHAIREMAQCVDATIAKLGLAICHDEQYNQWHASSWVQDAVRVGVSIEAVPASCTWTPDDDGNYATGCDGLFVILEGTPAENKMAYCCYCGKPIKEQPK